MTFIGITRGDDLPDDCTIVIHKPAVPDARMPATVMMEQAELLADALEKYLPGVTLMTLRDALGRRIHGAIARQVSKVLAEQDEPIGQRVYEMWRGSVVEKPKSASADRGYDTLSCGHVATRFSTTSDTSVPLVSRLPLDDSGIARPVAWCGECGMWIGIDEQQATELAREIREAMP